MTRKEELLPEVKAIRQAPHPAYRWKFQHSAGDTRVKHRAEQDQRDKNRFGQLAQDLETVYADEIDREYRRERPESDDFLEMAAPQGSVIRIAQSAGTSSASKRTSVC